MTMEEPSPMASTPLFARTAARAVLVGALATVALSACSGESLPVAGGSAGTTPTGTTAPASPTQSSILTSTGSPAPSTITSSKASLAVDRVLKGTRRVVIVPVSSFESILALDARGRLNLTDGDTDSSLFVFTPVNNEYLIKTAKANKTGEPSCLRVRGRGSNPLTVVAAACDTRDANQLFTVTFDKRDSQGHRTYVVSNQSAFLQVVHGELIAEEIGDSTLKTSFRLVDNGKATLPALD
jgi:hypothetical protein